jgi:hypothetical protein
MDLNIPGQQDLIIGNDNNNVARLTVDGELTVPKIKADGSKLDLSNHATIQSLLERTAKLESTVTAILNCFKNNNGNANQQNCLRTLSL